MNTRYGFGFGISFIGTFSLVLGQNRGSAEYARKSSLSVKVTGAFFACPTLDLNAGNIEMKLIVCDNAGNIEHEQY